MNAGYNNTNTTTNNNNNKTQICISIYWQE